MKVLLERYDFSDEGTFGIVSVDSGDNCRDYFFSMELPWRLNLRGKSCIPAGVYKCSQVYWPKHSKMAYQVQDVKDRDGILIHAATYAGNTDMGFKSHLEGCIALGERLGTMDGQKALLLSSPAVRRFEAILKKEPFELEIR